VWEVPEIRDIRVTWNQAYRSRVQGIVFVIDASDHGRLQEAHEQLVDILEDRVMTYVPCLILANKQDLPGALGVNDLAERLKVREIWARPWHIKVKINYDVGVLC